MPVNILPIDAWKVGAEQAAIWAKAERIFDELSSGYIIAMYGERDATGTYKTREVNGPWIGCAPRDTLYMAARMRSAPATETPENSTMGLRFGFDTYSAQARIQGYEGPWVPIGTSKYIKKTYSVTLPNDDRIAGFIGWLQVWTGYRNGLIIPEMATAYFADTELYINDIPAPAPKPSLAARVPSVGNSALVQTYMRRLRDKFISEELHKKIHPVV